MICTTYTSSVLPVLLMAPVMKAVEKFADWVSPNVLKAFLKPLLFVLINVPVALIILGPIGNVVGTLLAQLLSVMYNTCGWLTVCVLAALMPFIVMTGMHYALIPLAVNSMVTFGYDAMMMVTMFCSNIAQGGASLGVAVKTHNTETRSEGIASGISATIAGVTEPAMYGINMRYGKPLVAAITGAAVAGLICGLSGVRCYMPGGSPSVFSLVTFIGGTEPLHGVVFGVISGAAALVISFVLTIILHRDPDIETSETIDDTEGHHIETKSENPSSQPAESESNNTQCIIQPPIKGEIIPLEAIEDKTFSSGVLGIGYGIIPSEGKVYAPFDGVCDNILDTCHAMGLRSNQGVELLIHVGLETVRLDGKPFKPHVTSGEKIHQGQLLLEFNIDKIRKAGCDTVTPVLITNADDFSRVTVDNENIVVEV